MSAPGPCLNLTIDASHWPFGFMVCQLRAGTKVGFDRSCILFGDRVPRNLPVPLRQLVKQLIDFGPVLSFQIKQNRAGGNSFEFTIIPTPDDLSQLCRLLGRYLGREVDTNNILDVDVPMLLKDLLNEALAELE